MQHDPLDPTETALIYFSIFFFFVPCPASYRLWSFWVFLDVVKDLAFHDRADVSCLAVDVMQRVAEKSDAMRVAIGRMIKYNIPRFLRLTDVTDDDNYGNGHSHHHDRILPECFSAVLAS